MDFRQKLTESIRLLGFKIGTKPTEQEFKSFAIPQNIDGASTVQTGGIYGTYVDLEGTAKNEAEMITRYRDMALQAECKQAIKDIANEAIVQNGPDVRPTVSINLETLEYSDSIKDSIRESFDDVLQLLNFDDDAAKIFKKWYIDGRLYYHVLIDENDPKAGIKELKYLNPCKIRKIREIKKRIGNQGHELVEGILEYFIYNERGITSPDANATVGLKISADSICYVHSGEIDGLRNMVMGHLHKAIKPLNQLRAMEDAHVIYRLSRAAERRVFYIDVGNMPTQTAEKYVKQVMSDFRNKLVYDSQTGEVRDDKKFLSMQEDFFLARREGGKGTQIDTLQSASNLNQIEDIKFFQERLYKSLDVPVSRLKSDSGFGLGRSAEVQRDEYNFTKYIRELQHQFAHLFKELLKVQLLLKGVISLDDWDYLRQNIHFDYQHDQYYSEIRDGEILTGRLNLLQLIEPFVGGPTGYYSRAYVKKYILFQTEEEILRIQKELEEELAAEQEVADEEAARNAGVGVDGKPFAPDFGQAPGGTPKNPFKKKKNNLSG